MLSRMFASFAVGFLLLAVPTFAQEKSSWGLSVAFVPSWEVPSSFDVVFADEPVDVNGSEFRVGIVRGSDLGGDWGISFVQKSVSDTSTLGEPVAECFRVLGCGRQGSSYVLDEVSLVGVEVHKYVPFTTIRERVQIGMTFGGGIVRVNGQATELTYDPFITADNGIILGASDRPPTVREVDASELFRRITEVLPLGRLEFTVAAILAPGLKVRASSGIDFPEAHVVNLSISYLFGREQE